MELRFHAHIAGQRAELVAKKVIANATLNARTSAARQIAAYYQSDEVQTAIRQSALGSVPALLRAAGVDPEAIPDINANGRLDPTDIATYLEQHPELAARLFGLARQYAEQKEALPHLAQPEPHQGIPVNGASPHPFGPEYHLLRFRGMPPMNHQRPLVVYQTENISARFKPTSGSRLKRFR